MIAFTVYKSSKYLFDCIGATDGAQSESDMTGPWNAFEALRINAVDVVKRMDYMEVDKLIACGRPHVRPPQTLVRPATHGDIAPFQKFVKYLTARQRAGVAILAEGRLLILVPMGNDDLRLRCVVANAKPLETSAAHATTNRSHEAPYAQLSQTEPQAQPPPPLPQQKSDKSRCDRARPYRRAHAQQKEVAETSRQESLTERHRHVQAKAVAPAFAPNKELTMLHSLPRLERATRIAQLRKEYEAFHKLHYEVLQGWSKFDSD